LVDPEGFLFWSFGPVSVTPTTGRTSIANGQHVYADSVIWRKGQRLLRGKRWWNPLATNLYRRDGENWLEAWATRQHIRLRSWGFNSIGNWSEPALTNLHETPYVVPVHYQRPSMGTATHSTRATVPDCYAEDFYQVTLDALRRPSVLKAARDPYCIGIFIDNELPINSPTTPATLTLSAAADQPAKQAFVDYLKRTHGTIKKLNRAWKQNFNSWQALQAIDTVPQPANRALHQDFRGFSKEYLERYYRLCAQAVKEVAPQKLYLGSRINHFNNGTLLSAAAQHCDVVSMNVYQFSVRHLPVPRGFDKPVLIG
jgi:hypothetical protein